MDISYPLRDPDAIHHAIREPHTSGIRRQPSKELQARILTEQNARCLYCGCRFGSRIERAGFSVVLRLEWDHAVPFSYLNTNPDDNWVAACHVCNGIKGSLMFDEFEDAIAYILNARQRKRYRPVRWTPKSEAETEMKVRRIVDYVEYDLVKPEKRLPPTSPGYVRVRQMRFTFKEHKRRIEME